MIINYENIMFNVNICDAAYEVGLMAEDEGIGFTVLDIPSNHIISMKRDGYYTEHEYNDKIYNLPPHMYPEDYENDKQSRLIYINRDLIDSYNTDLHIVYFKWMLEKQRTKFHINIMCENPYWIFHDICHIDDVIGSEVCCINPQVEEHRLLQGLELMVSSGYTPEFTEDYYDRMESSFQDRFRESLDSTIFDDYIEYIFEEH